MDTGRWGSSDRTTSEGARGESTGGISTAGLLEPNLYVTRLDPKYKDASDCHVTELQPFARLDTGTSK